MLEQLRKETGCGLMDCKKALYVNDNNYEKAKHWLLDGKHLKWTI